MSEEINFLVEAGFSKGKAEKALSVNNNNVQEALEWLLIHNNEIEEPEPSQSSSSSVSNQVEPTAENAKQEDVKPTETAETEETQESLANLVNSLKCDDCGILFRDEDFATAHAHKTGHVNFSQSSEAIKPKTKEEIEDQKKRLAEKLIRLRQEKQEKERVDEIEREKARRKQGRQLNEIKQKFHEEELKRIAEEKRRDKLADQAYKQRIKDEIARDREAFKKSQENSSSSSTATKVPAPVASTSIASVGDSSQAPPEKKQYNECKIQVRLTDGKSMVQSFKPNEPLAAVRLWIEMNRTDGTGNFHLMQTFPRKVYNDDDMMRPLSDLGLVPASTLVLSKNP